MKLNRVDANLVPFAKNNVNGYRFVFGTDVISDDINVNYNANILKGWGTSPNEFPEVEDFNALAYTSTYLTSYLYQVGIPEWNEKQEYYINSIVKASNGILYRSITGTEDSPNIGNNPTEDKINWNEYLSDYVSKDFLNNNFLNLSKVSYDLNTSSFIPNTLTSGVIIEVGRNANGEYIKFADGTLICRNTNLLSLTGYNNGNYRSISFPHAFIDTSYSLSFYGWRAESDNNMFFLRGGGSHNNVGFNVTTSTTIPSLGTQFDYIAIGRWK
ncbi:hypothetical protein H0A43_07495 [Arcobacter lanthieri]|uniref:hypothetical protein n=1 Tax=Aliarcobacter lanthieri TaxID=1355374 RepID=UPI001922ED09|nr:hypothetical protein [Aliarcobacter lanthieri]MBL3520316.1 hypothetical protein [Aliarcobacter lanthieri]